MRPVAGPLHDLALAGTLATAALELGVFLGDPPQYMEDLAEGVSEQLAGILSVLYQAAEPMLVDELSDRACDVLGVRPGHESTVRAYLERALTRFERLGMLQRLGVQVEMVYELEIERATSVTLTPLGVWWLQQTLTAFGLRAPRVGELAVVSAGELADGLADYPMDAAEREIAAWIAVRGTDEAARQIAALLTEGEVVRRQFALQVLDDLPDAQTYVRPLLDDPVARPYAVVWLQSNGHHVDPAYHRPEDARTLFVDTAGMLVQAGGSDELLARLAGIGDEPDQVALVRDLWRVESPYTEPVLRVISDSKLPAVSTAARKALFSLRSARRGAS